MTATVNFENPQVQVGDGTTGIEISPIIIPYSIHNNDDPLQYLGGQVVLTKEDGVAFSDNTADWYKKALVKIKDMVADTEIYTPNVVPEVDATDDTSETETHDATTESEQPDTEPVINTLDVSQLTGNPDATHATQE